MDYFSRNWQELIGYLASVFIILSMMQHHITRVRLFMMAGCLTFMVYGYLIDAIPVMIANGMIFAVTVFYFVKSLTKPA